MLEGAKNKGTLEIIMRRMKSIEVKLSREEGLTADEEKFLKLNLFDIEGEKRDFRDEAHRDKLLAQWWRRARFLAKKFDNEEKRVVK